VGIVDMWRQARGAVMRKELDDIKARMLCANDVQESAFLTKVAQTIDAVIGAYASAPVSDRRALLKAMVAQTRVMWASGDWPSALGFSISCLNAESQFVPGDDAAYVKRDTDGIIRNAKDATRTDAGNNAVDIAATMLLFCINLGSAGPGEPNRSRLDSPFARGYIFGVSDACIQRLEGLEEVEALASITVIYVKMFGVDAGSLLVGGALRDQLNTEFCRGRNVGAADLFQWLDERSHTPLALTDYLHEDDTRSNSTAPPPISRATPVLEPAPRKWNTGLIRKKTMSEDAASRGCNDVSSKSRRLHIRKVKVTKDK
jgi:hypothetical protein